MDATFVGGGRALRERAKEKRWKLQHKHWSRESAEADSSCKKQSSSSTQTVALVPVASVSHSQEDFRVMGTREGNFASFVCQNRQKRAPQEKCRFGHVPPSLQTHTNPSLSCVMLYTANVSQFITNPLTASLVLPSKQFGK